MLGSMTRVRRSQPELVVVLAACAGSLGFGCVSTGAVRPDLDLTGDPLAHVTNAGLKVKEEVVSDKAGATTAERWQPHYFVAAAGPYRLRATFPCQEPVEKAVDVVAGRERRVSYAMPLPAPTFRLVLAEITDKVWSTDWRTAERTITVAKHSVVKLLRVLPDDRDHCARAAVVIVDAASPALTGAYLVVPLGELSAPEPNEAEARAHAQRNREAEARGKLKRQQQRTEALAALVEEERKTERCRQDRYNTIQQVIEGTSQMLAATSDSNYYVEDRAVAVATDEGTTVQLTAGAGGRYHLFVLGFEPVTMIVKDRQGYEVQVRSPYEFFPANNGFPTASRVLQVGAHDRMSIVVKARGCVGLMAVRQWP